MISSFQLTRSTELRLTHRTSTEKIKIYRILRSISALG
jgi:hypothetical protein